MFAVFGVSKVKCRAKAEKEVNSHDSRTGNAFTLLEYTARLEQRTDELFRTAKVQKISDIYPIKGLAEDYRDKVREAGTAKNVALKKRVCEMLPDGITPKLNEKGKQVGMKWIAC